MTPSAVSVLSERPCGDVTISLRSSLIRSANGLGLIPAVGLWPVAMLALLSALLCF